MTILFLCLGGVLLFYLVWRNVSELSPVERDIKEHLDRKHAAEKIIESAEGTLERRAAMLNEPQKAALELNIERARRIIEQSEFEISQLHIEDNDEKLKEIEGA